jgi:hypothetical protein
MEDSTWLVDSTWFQSCRGFLVPACPGTGEWENQSKGHFAPLCTQAGDPIRDRERPHGQRVNEAKANWNDGYIPSHLGEGKRRIFFFFFFFGSNGVWTQGFTPTWATLPAPGEDLWKGKSWRIPGDHQFRFWLEELLLSFHFLFPQ